MERRLELQRRASINRRAIARLMMRRGEERILAGEDRAVG